MRAGRVYLTSNPKIILEQIIKQLICKHTSNKKIMLKIVVITETTQTKKTPPPVLPKQHIKLI